MNIASTQSISHLITSSLLSRSQIKTNNILDKCLNGIGGWGGVLLNRNGRNFANGKFHAVGELSEAFRALETRTEDPTSRLAMTQRVSSSWQRNINSCFQSSHHVCSIEAHFPAVICTAHAPSLGIHFDGVVDELWLLVPAGKELYVSNCLFCFVCLLLLFCLFVCFCLFVSWG